MQKNVVWSLMFSVAIAILMLAVLLTRSEVPPLWVLIVYPAIGAALAQVASRTSPNPDEIAWIETGTIAAACIVVLAALVNILLIELLLREILSGNFLAGSLPENFTFFVLPTISLLLWWALERRLARMRKTDHVDAVDEMLAPRQSDADTGKLTASSRRDRLAAMAEARLAEEQTKAA